MQLIYVIVVIRKFGKKERASKKIDEKWQKESLNGKLIHIAICLYRVVNSCTFGAPSLNTSQKKGDTMKKNKKKGVKISFALSLSLSRFYKKGHT